MPKFSRGVLRLLGVLAVVALLQPLASSRLLGSDAGRNFSRCVQVCNDVNNACGIRCQDDCRTMFPNNKQQRDACTAACKADCQTQLDECKLVCHAIKDGISPTEP